MSFNTNGKKTLTKAECNADHVFRSFWRNIKSNSVFLMNTKRLILHSWQVSVSHITEICGYSSSGVRTRAIEVMDGEGCFTVSAPNLLTFCMKVPFSAVCWESSRSECSQL